MDYKLSHVQDGKVKVYGEIRCSAFVGPGITGACILLCIAYAEVGVEAQSVELHDLFAAEGEVDEKYIFGFPCWG